MFGVGGGGNGEHYDVELNKADLSIRWLKAKLNERFQDGWALKDIFVKDDNTVIVFERYR